LRSSGLWHHVVFGRQDDTNVSEDHAAPVFRVKSRNLLRLY